MDWHKDFYSIWRGRVSANASMMVVSTCTSLMALKNWHALRTWPCSLKAILSPCRGTTLTVGPASKNKSYKNGVFSFTCDLDLFVLLEVSIRLMFIIRLKCVELAELALWLRLELGLCCLPCERPKTRSTFFCSENTQEVDVVAVLITALSCPTPAIRVVPKPYCLEVRPRRTSNEFSSRWLSEIVGHSNVADYSSSTVVGRALILPVLSCNDVYVILSRILNKTCRQDWPITARRAEIRHVGTRVNWRQFFTDRSGKYFITVAVSSPKTTCVTADHVHPNKFPMNRPIIYHLSHDNSHLLRDIFILSHDQWDLLHPFWNHWWSLFSDSDWL